MPLFSIDYNKLINQLLPVRLRKPVYKAWLQALIAPVKYIYRLFTNKRATDLYFLSHNGQVVYLQAALNDIFDNALRRITIADNDNIAATYIYIAAEEKPVPVYLDSENTPVYLYTDEEIANAFNGFIVQVPTALTFDTAYMKAVVDKYRLASKNQYIIKTV